VKRWLRRALGAICAASVLVSLICYAANEKLAEGDDP